MYRRWWIIADTSTLLQPIIAGLFWGQTKSKNRWLEWPESSQWWSYSFGLRLGQLQAIYEVLEPISACNSPNAKLATAMGRIVMADIGEAVKAANSSWIRPFALENLKNRQCTGMVVESFSRKHCVSNTFRIHSMIYRYNIGTQWTIWWSNRSQSRTWPRKLSNVDRKVGCDEVSILRENDNYFSVSKLGVWKLEHA